MFVNRLCPDRAFTIIPKREDPDGNIHVRSGHAFDTPFGGPAASLL
jgi:hypothetical protein